MTRIVSIEIQTHSIGITSLGHILSCLFDHGWDLDLHGKIRFLPEGGRDEFAWKEIDVAKKEEVFGVINGKEKAGEIAGVVIFHSKHQVGAQLLAFPPNSIEGKEIRRIDLILDANRRKLENALNLTDVSWYLPRLIPALLEAGLIITSVHWEENL